MRLIHKNRLRKDYGFSLNGQEGSKCTTLSKALSVAGGGGNRTRRLPSQIRVFQRGCYTAYDTEEIISPF
jgi:hypothetical protein